MRIFLNGLAASAGAGLTYLHNVVPHLSAVSGLHTTLAVQPGLRAGFEGLPNVDVIYPPRTLGTASRFWFEQRKLPALIRRQHADALISAGNFALRNSPVPQILLSGNALYSSRHFSKDLLSRREYLLLIDNRLKGLFAERSVRWAEQTVAPTQAFAEELRRWTGKGVAVIHHGFDRRTFFDDAVSLPEHVAAELKRTEGCLRLLFVSHYNYYRNFETLFRALPWIRAGLPGENIVLLLTCKLDAGLNPGAYDGTAARKLIQELGMGEQVIELGAVPYRALHHLYRACDVYVSAAYAETFAHPLVEAMASGLPIVASDLPAHREVCRDAARYFPCFSCDELAGRVLEVANSENLARQLKWKGIQRSADFSWARHVTELLNLACRLCRAEQPIDTLAHMKAADAARTA